jgi:hypothetical protein
MADANRSTAAIKISDEERQIIMKALLIGLESFGEIERLTDRVEVASKVCGETIPNGCTPIHPTGEPDTIGCFAQALRVLHGAQSISGSACHG